MIPADSGVIVMGTSIDRTVAGMGMGTVGLVLMLEGKLEHTHPRQVPLFPQLNNFIINKTKIFSDKRQRAEFTFYSSKKV